MFFIIFAIAIFVALASAIDAIDAAGVRLSADRVLEDSIPPSTCSNGFVDCRSGMAFINGHNKDISCYKECDGFCCSGGNDDGDTCQNFSGLVCKDGSCSADDGSSSCNNANIGQVINSCKGDKACADAGGDGGYISQVIDSCHGEEVCANAAKTSGSIGSILNSCYGQEGCALAASDDGSIGIISDSCKHGQRNCFAAAKGQVSMDYIIRSCSGTAENSANDVCYALGQGDNMYGVRDGIIDYSSIQCADGFVAGTDQSCHEACAASFISCCDPENACEGFTGVVSDGSCSGDRACADANIGLVDNSCSGDHACADANIGLVDNSCRGDRACADANIGSVHNSCFGQTACQDAGGDSDPSCGHGVDCVDGHIGKIQDSCDGILACAYAGANGGSIDIIQDSCNNGSFNCLRIAGRGGRIGSIISSCSGTADALISDACAEVGMGKDVDIDNITDCCNSETMVCCQSDNVCSKDAVPTLPAECAAKHTVGTRGFARHVANE